MESLALALVAMVGASLVGTASVQADAGELRFGVGVYQPDKEKIDATYRPLAAYLAKRQAGRSSSTRWTPGKGWPGRWRPGKPASR